MKKLLLTLAVIPATISQPMLLYILQKTVPVVKETVVVKQPVIVKENLQLLKNILLMYR